MNSIVNYIIESLKNQELITDTSTVLLCGSLSFELKKKNQQYKKYFDGSSDIDLIIIDESLQFLENILNSKEYQFINENNIDIINYKYKYGIGRNSLNIKYIALSNLKKILNLKEISFKSYRKDPLCRYKSYIYCRPCKFNEKERFLKYKEIKKERYYILNYKFKPMKNDVYYMSDIHSMMLFNEVIIANPKSISLLKEFKNKILNLIRNRDLSDVKYMLEYFYGKNNITIDNEKKVLEEIYES